MPLSVKNKQINEVKEKLKSIRRESFKTFFYLAFLAVLLSIINFVFGWEEITDIPLPLQPHSDIIIPIKPYVTYIQAFLVFVLGYLAVNTISGMVYTYLRKITDHPTAAAIKTVTRISGIALLLSMTASVFNVNPATALTLGSFGGLVIGFATQTIFSHVVAGIFLLLTRPFKYGDMITVLGKTGVVKEIKLMHLVLESPDGKSEFLIPSGTVVTQVIQRMIPEKT